MTLDEVYMIGVFDSVSYEASKPSSWKFGVPVINPFSGKELTENEVKIVKELYGRKKIMSGD